MSTKLIVDSGIFVGRHVGPNAVQLFTINIDRSNLEDHEAFAVLERVRAAINKELQRLSNERGNNG